MTEKTSQPEDPPLPTCGDCVFLYRGARCVESPPQASGAERGVRHVPDNPACRHYRPTTQESKLQASNTANAFTAYNQ